MNKVVPLKVLRILAFIPYLNFCTCLIWFHNYRVAVTKPYAGCISVILVVVASVPCRILGNVLRNLCTDPSVHTAIRHLLFYLDGILCSWVLILYQKRVIPPEHHFTGKEGSEKAE